MDSFNHKNSALGVTLFSFLAAKECHVFRQTCKRIKEYYRNSAVNYWYGLNKHKEFIRSFRQCMISRCNQWKWIDVVSELGFARLYMSIRDYNKSYRVDIKCYIKNAIITNKDITANELLRKCEKTTCGDSKAIELLSYKIPLMEVIDSNTMAVVCNMNIIRVGSLMYYWTSLMPRDTVIHYIDNYKNNEECIMAYDIFA